MDNVRVAPIVDLSGLPQSYQLAEWGFRIGRGARLPSIAVKVRFKLDPFVRGIIDNRSWSLAF